MGTGQVGSRSHIPLLTMLIRCSAASVRCRLCLAEDGLESEEESDDGNDGGVEDSWGLVCGTTSVSTFTSAKRSSEVDLVGCEGDPGLNRGAGIGGALVGDLPRVLGVLFRLALALTGVLCGVKVKEI